MILNWIPIPVRRLCIVVNAGMMLQGVRPQYVCRSCQQNLRLRHRRKFYTSVNTSLPSITAPSVRSSNILSVRAISTSHRRDLGAKYGQDTIHKSEFSSLTEEQVLASQHAAVEALERDLSQRVGDQIENASSIAAVDFANIDGSHGLDDSTYDAAGHIERMRAEGVPLKNIVEGARGLLGDTLPQDLLTPEELKLYTRLYGEPASPPELSKDIDVEDGYRSLVLPSNELYTVHGEQIEYDSSPREIQEKARNEEEIAAPVSTAERHSGETRPHETESERNLRISEVAKVVRGSIVGDGEVQEFEEDYEDEPDERAHPLTELGRFATSPRTVFLSQEEFVHPFENIMSKYSNKHLKEMCERTFGGPGLPNSPLTPRSGVGKQQLPVALNANQHFMGEMEANAFVAAVMPPTYASIRSVLVETRKRLGPTWLNNLLSRDGGPRVLDAGSGGVGIIAWREVVQAHWDSLHTSDRQPASMPASKTVVLTGSDELRHRAAAMLENTTFIPRLPDYVHTRGGATLEDDRPAQARKQFDVIIASHSLFAMKEEFMRKQHVQNLWSMLNPDGGVLILIEKGIPRGFEAIAGAREMLLERHIAIPEGRTTHYSQFVDDPLHKKEKAMIVAPCTNHEKCPMYTALGLSRGRKDICSFQQRYIRPPFLQRVLGAKDRNHDDVDFSYLTVIKGEDLRERDVTTWEQLSDPLAAPIVSNPPKISQNYEGQLDAAQEGFENVTPDHFATLPAAHSQESGQTEATQPSQPGDTSKTSLPITHSLPRSVFPPMKRRGHVIIDMCTPAGKIERWTIPRSFGKQAYRDARKAKWGDLWALGAKTRMPRSLQLGTPQKDSITRGQDGKIIIGKGRGRKERLKLKAMEILEQREEDKLTALSEERAVIQQLHDELVDRIDEPSGDDESYFSRSKSQAQVTDRELSKRNKSLPKQTLYKVAPDSNSDTGTNEMPFISPNSNLTDEQVEQILSAWEAEHDALLDHGKAKGKKGGAYSPLSTSSKEAKRMQKARDKTPRNPDRSGRSFKA